MTKVRTTVPSMKLLTRWNNLREWLIAPHPSITEVGARGRAQLLSTLSLVFAASLLLGLLFRPRTVTAFIAILAIAAVSYILSRTRYFNLGALIFSLGLISYPTFAIILGTTTDFQSTIATFIPISLILAGSLLSRNSFMVVGLIATLLTFMDPLFGRQPIDQEAIRTVGLIFSTALILFSVNIYRENIERRRLFELTNLNTELGKMKTELEARVEQRTFELTTRTEELALRSQDFEDANLRLQKRSAQFEAISHVSRSIAAVRDLSTLLPDVATTISESFGYYHVGIFLLDEAGKYAVLRATNSEGGRRMLQRAHKLQVGEQGIVGLVTGTARPRIALDVGDDIAYFDNPDLPETRSEMALPLKSGEKVVGALDVQSKAPNAFGHEDVDLLSLLADQVSLAIENARLFEETQRSLAEAEAFSRQYLREGWGRLTAQQQLVGFRYDPTGASPLNKPVPVSTGDGSSGPAADLSQLAIPIELRGEILGDLVIQAPGGRKWTQDELDLIRAVADRVALSAENARLFDETSRRAERERMVSDITSKIRSSNDPGEMIKLAVQELKNALGVNRIEVVPQRVTTESKR